MDLSEAAVEFAPPNALAPGVGINFLGLSPLLEEEANRSFSASHLPICRFQDAG
jgi:hypothetical protein